MNIKSHDPVELDIAESNYTEWRCFFNAFIGKFSLRSHLSLPPTAAIHGVEHDRSMPPQLALQICVRVPKATTYAIWHAIHAQLRGNELHRAVDLEAEFKSPVQGDMDITTYTSRIKQLDDALRDVRHLVHETSHFLNMLYGLNFKYQHTVP
jgi:hypothetical protein